jgi:hypothetical protein
LNEAPPFMTVAISVRTPVQAEFVKDSCRRYLAVGARVGEGPKTPAGTGPADAKYVDCQTALDQAPAEQC